jgi:hypothetical protein
MRQRSTPVRAKGANTAKAALAEIAVLASELQSVDNARTELRDRIDAKRATIERAKPRKVKFECGEDLLLSWNLSSDGTLYIDMECGDHKGRLSMDSAKALIKHLQALCLIE